MAPELFKRLEDEHSDRLHGNRSLPNVRVVAMALPALSRWCGWFITDWLLLPILLLEAIYVIEWARCTRQRMLMLFRVLMLFGPHGAASLRNLVVHSSLDGRWRVESGGSLAVHHGANVDVHLDALLMRLGERRRLLLVLLDLRVDPLDKTLPMEGRTRNFHLLLVSIVTRNATTAWTLSIPTISISIAAIKARAWKNTTAWTSSPHRSICFFFICNNNNGK